MSGEQFNFRVEAELKKAFLQKARDNGTTASELLVGFIQEYVGVTSSSNVQAVEIAEINTRLSELEKCLSERIAVLEERLPGKQKKIA